MTQFIQPKCSPGKTLGQQNNKNVPPVKHRVNKMTLEGNIVHLLMSLDFTNLYLVLN